MKKRTLKEKLFPDPVADKEAEFERRERVSDETVLMTPDELRDSIMEVFDFDEGYRAKSEIPNARVARAMADQYKFFHLGIDNEPTNIYERLYGKGTDFVHV